MSETYDEMYTRIQQMGRQETADEINRIIGQGRSGLKAGVDITYATLVGQHGKDLITADYLEQKKHGLDKFSQQRANLGWDNWGDKPPETTREFNQQLRYTKTILQDKSSTVAGAEQIMDNLSKLYGQPLTKTQTVNLLRIMGKAQRRGMRTSERTISSKEYAVIFEQLPTEEMPPEEIEKAVDDFERHYKEKTGLAIPKEEQERLQAIEEEIFGPRPKAKKMPKVKVAKTTQNASRKSLVRGDTHRRLTENTNRKHRRKPPKKY